MYTYIANDLLQSVNIDVGGDTKTILTVLYDETSRIKTRTFVSSYTDYTYNPNTGEIISIEHKFLNGSLISEYHLEYDHMGRVTKMNTSGGNWEYGYDINGRLSSWQMSGGSQASIVYNARGKRVSMQSSAGQSSCVTNQLGQYTSCGNDRFSWDGNGNMISIHKDGVKVDSNTYDEFNKLISSRENRYVLLLIVVLQFNAEFHNHTFKEVF